MAYKKDYTTKTADEWFTMKKWTGFLMTIPLGRTVGKECENMRDVLAIRAVASRLTNDDLCERQFSLTTDPGNERMIYARAEKK